MVFQNYALYPHMSVTQNIAFSLSMRGIGNRARVTAGERVTLEVDLEHLHFFDPETGAALERR